MPCPQPKADLAYLRNEDLAQYLENSDKLAC